MPRETFDHVINVQMHTSLSDYCWNLGCVRRSDDTPLDEHILIKQLTYQKVKINSKSIDLSLGCYIVDIISPRGTRKLVSVPIVKYLYHWF